MAIISRILEWKLVPRAAKEMQKELKEKQNEYNKFIKEGKGATKESEKLQSEVMEMTLKLMQSRMKVMYVSLILFGIAWWVLGTQFGGKTFEALHALPKFNGFFLLNPFSWVPTGLTIQTGMLKAYVFSSLEASIAITIILKLLRKFNAKEILEKKFNLKF